MTNPIMLVLLATFVVFVGFPESVFLTYFLYGYFGFSAMLSFICLLVLAVQTPEKLLQLREFYITKSKKELMPMSINVPVHLGLALVFFSHTLYFFVVCSIISLLFYQADSWFHREPAK